MTNSVASPLLRGSFIHIALPAPLYTSAPSTEPGSVLTQGLALQPPAAGWRQQSTARLMSNWLQLNTASDIPSNTRAGSSQPTQMPTLRARYFLPPIWPPCRCQADDEGSQPEHTAPSEVLTGYPAPPWVLMGFVRRLLPSQTWQRGQRKLLPAPSRGQEYPSHPES